jgi:hypothetical protein
MNLRRFLIFVPCDVHQLHPLSVDYLEEGEDIFIIIFQTMPILSGPLGGGGVFVVSNNGS